MAISSLQLITVEWVMIGFTFFIVLFRIYSRIARAQKLIPELSDIFLIIAWLSFLLQAGLDTAVYRVGWFDGDGDGLDEPTQEYALKILFVESVTYLNCMYAIKASMLLLYHGFFPKHMKKMRVALKVTDACVAIGWTSEVLVNIFGCWPLERIWDINAEECSYGVYMWGVQTAAHLLTDMMVYVLPIIVVWKMSLVRKGSYVPLLILSFSLGFLCLFFAAANVAAGVLSDNVTTGWFFAVLEQTWAVMVGCAPSLNVLWVEGRRVWKEKSTSLFSKSDSSSSGERSKPDGRSDGPLVIMSTRKVSIAMSKECSDIEETAINSFV